MTEPLVLLHGEDQYLVTAAARALRDQLCQDLISDLGLEEFKGSSDLDEIERSLATPPFIAIRRVVVIWDPPQLATGKRAGRDAERLLEVLEARADTTATAVVVRGLLPPSSSFIKGVRHLGGEVRLLPRPRGRELRRHVGERIRARGLNLAEPVVQLLMDVAGHDLGWLEMELDKLELYQENGQRIGEEEGTRLVTGAPPTELYRLTDAIFESPASVGARLRSALGRADIQPQVVVGALARMLRDLVSFADPGEAARWSSVPPRRRERLSGHLSRAGRVRLARWLVALSQLDWETRTGRVDAAEGLEALVARMASEVAAAPVRRRTEPGWSGGSPSR
jgi:DNA polymerase-3 subunit delta